MSKSREARSLRVIQWMLKRIYRLLSYSQEPLQPSNRRVSRKSRGVRLHVQSFDSLSNKKMAFKDIRKSRKLLSAEEIRLLALLLFILIAALAANLALARNLPGGEWLFL